MNQRALVLGLKGQTAANVNRLGGQLMENNAPGEKERKLWRLLKGVRERQAKWRGQEKRWWLEKVKNPDDLTEQVVEQAAKLYVGLKERKCAYGDYVFNFAFPEPGRAIQPIKVPKGLPEIIWTLGREEERHWPAGVPMVRVDAIRQLDNTIRIIELNPNWVDNIAALEAFGEVYSLPLVENKPVEMMARLVAEAQERFLNRNLALLYMDQTDGCKKDEIYSLSEYLGTTGYFGQIVVAGVREVRNDGDENLAVRGVPVSAIYLNGAYQMVEESASEKMGIDKIKRAQANGSMVMAPAQFIELNSKEFLVRGFGKRPDLFAKTVTRPEVALDWRFPLIVKPVRSESLKGVSLVDTKEELLTFADKGKFVFQPMMVFARGGIICCDTKLKTVFRPALVYEKINLWILADKLVGGLACYSPTPLINDAGYNLPILWEEI